MFAKNLKKTVRILVNLGCLWTGIVQQNVVDVVVSQQQTFVLLLNCIIPGNIYLFKVNRNIRKRCEICLKLTIKTPDVGTFLSKDSR